MEFTSVSHSPVYEADIEVEFMRGIIDALSSHICVLDSAGDILLTNKAWQLFSEANNGNSAGYSNRNYLVTCRKSAEDGCTVAARFHDGIRQVLDGKIPSFVMEYDCHSPTEERWFYCRANRLLHNGVKFAVVSHENITLKVLAERSLEQSEALFRATFDQSVTGMVQCDLSGNFVRVNRAFCRITGYSESELLSKTFMDITLPEDLVEDVNQAHLLISGKTRHGYSLEKRYYRKDREIIWVNLHASLVRDHEGSPLYLVGVVEDISDRKRAEARAQELNMKLEQRLNMLTQPDMKCSSLQFMDLFDLDELQKLQDSLASSLGVSSIITDTEGVPITTPSNFCELCRNVIRKTEKGKACCTKSNSCFGVEKAGDSFISNCKSLGLLNGGTSIFVGERQIANWIVGQVVDESVDTELLLDYAGQIEADPARFKDALALVPRMTKEKFRKICNFVSQIASHLSTLALRNYQQARDIEIRIHVEQQLEYANRHYRQILQNAPLMIWRTEADGTLTWLNDTWLQFTGNTLEKELEQPWYVSLHPDDIEYCANVWREAIATNSSFKMEYRRINAAGEYRWVTDTGQPYIRANGTSAGFIGFCFDITERHEIEEDLRRSEAQLRTLIETTSEGFWAIDPVSYSTIKVNQALCRMLGYDSSDILGKKTIDFVDQKNREILLAQHSRIESTDHRRFEIDLTRRNGEQLATVFSASTLRDSSGKAVMAYAFISDIQERKRFEQEIQAARDAAEAASKAKSNFLANMSHELRTPLNSIIGFSELIYDGITGDVNEQQKDYLGNVLTSARHLLQVISEILDLSRIEAGKMKLEISPTGIDSLLLQVKSMFTEQAERNGITLCMETGHPADMVLIADEVKLRQVVINLVSNAIKFTDSGGRVVISSRVGGYETAAPYFVSDDDCLKHSGQFLEISVCDTGIGIREEDMSKLFQEFSQIAPAMTRNREGTGLGLALSKRLIELHRGRIRVTSRFGEGSDFSFILPLPGQERT